MYLESHNFLHEHQGTYRHGKSSEQILLFAVDSIVRALDQGLVVCSAFLDLRKAFDSLDHVILLERLQQLGVCGTELRWFQNYPSDCFQRVKCGTVFSYWKPVKGGIPQGSALGPLLFLIYVNNMPKQVQHGPLLQFADDTCLICCGSSSERVSKLLSEDLSLLSSWIAQSRMQVNVGKSCIMWFRISRPKSGVSLPPVYLNHSPLSCVVHHKYLGVHFDPQLSWDTHISNICKRMSYYLYLMSYHHRVLPSCILKLLANSLVISQLTYALPVWGPSLKVNLCSRLHRLYNRAVRVVCGLRKYDHVASSRRTLGWLPLDNLMKHCAVNLMFRHYANSDCVVFDPPIEFGSNHSYDTRTPFYFCQIPCCKTSFGQRFFRSRVANWWNDLPSSLFNVSRRSDFSWSVYNYLFN